MKQSLMNLQKGRYLNKEELIKKLEKLIKEKYSHNDSCNPRGGQNSPPWMPCYHNIEKGKGIEEAIKIIKEFLAEKR